jgi:gluconokinase
MSTAKAIIILGVSGCGKSTVGAALARELRCDFLDADDFHPAANKEKMRAGLALDDDDRAPWLATLNAALRFAVAENRSVVLACSALKERYRVKLRENVPTAQFVHLVGTQDEIAARLAARNHEYMPATLLASQFAALEKPTDAIDVPVAWSVEEQVAFAKKRILSHNHGLVGV